MKSRFLVEVCAAFVLIVGVICGASQPVYGQAQEATFYCGTDLNGTPATIARTPRGEILVIVWEAEYVDSSSTPQKICEHVSYLLRINNIRNVLNWITTEKREAGYVVCVSKSKDGNCSGVLFALPSEEEPNKAIVQIFSTSPCGPNRRRHSRLYMCAAYTPEKYFLYIENTWHINVEVFLQTAPTLEPMERLYPR